MLFFGHRFLENESFYHITDIEAISKTPPSSTLFLDFNENNLDIIKHLNQNSLSFVLSVTNITEIVYASTLNAKYICISAELAKTAQSIAEDYMFDAKILAQIEVEKEIEELVLLGVDGVVFSNAIIKINS